MTGTLESCLAVAFLVITGSCTMVLSQNSPHDDMSDIQGNYCRTRRPETCCPNRDDGCSVPILGTLCYCDMFCNRTRSSDCCPDFWEHCMGIAPPDPYVRPHCIHSGIRYNVGQNMMLNCNKCTCKQTSYNQYEFSCEERACLVRPELVQSINTADLGWKAANYSLFWGRTLDEGIRYRLGTYKPTRPTMSMSEIHIDHRVPLPENFDSRQRWPGLIQPIMDQGNCGSSWAISTTAVASDRLAIQSDGVERERLSAQHLISCQNRKQRGCDGGHLDRAWWYLRKKGVATEKCFPYESGNTSQVGSCRARRFHHEEVVCPGSGRREKLHFSTPPYRVSPKEETIMQEIYANGPVQATLAVHEDFFVYRYGVYRKARMTDNMPSEFRQHGYHSVRILGWGVDRSSGRPIKYWLCTNSWGRQWGEDGYFRILRGENECDIEMFIVGVWGKRDDPGHRLRHNGVNDNRSDNEIRTRRL